MLNNLSLHSGLFFMLAGWSSYVSGANLRCHLQSDLDERLAWKPTHGPPDDRSQTSSLKNKPSRPRLSVYTATAGTLLTLTFTSVYFQFCWRKQGLNVIFKDTLVFFSVLVTFQNLGQRDLETNLQLLSSTASFLVL